MTTIEYPIFIYTLNENTVWGNILGTEYESIDTDINKVKNNLLKYLNKIYDTYSYYPNIALPEPKLRTIEVKVLPTYRENNLAFPLKEMIKIPVSVVYGSTGLGYYECYIPMLETNFVYYEGAQLEEMVKHFALNELTSMSPEKIYQFLDLPKPSLEIIKFKIKENKTKKSPYNKEIKLKNLNQLTEPYPLPKSQQNNQGNLPDVAWELDETIDNIVHQVMSMRVNLLLVGNRGVGKSAALKQALRKISSLNKSEEQGVTFWQLIAQRITARAKYLGEWQESVEELIYELGIVNGILWVNDITKLLETGGEGSEDSVAAYIQPYLQQGKVQIIGEVSPQELEGMRRLLPGFTECFQTLKIEELPEEKIINILHKYADYSANYLKISINKEAILTGYRLLQRYYPYESFPGKAVNFLGRCISEAKQEELSVINKIFVLKHFTKQTGMPELFLRDDLPLDVKELKDYFNNQIIGQSDACERMMSIVKIFKSHLNHPGKPIATLIFAGPTGVGKTAAAKALAAYFFGKGQQNSPLIRIDMSEFQYAEQLERLIGTGRETGKLVQLIREKPFSVLLLDEVEKASKSIYDALLSVFDEGKLTDSFGRETNFRNTIIIMTTNLGSSNQPPISFGKSANTSKDFDAAIASFFRPEFINRIDGIVYFKQLEKDDIRLITKKELSELNQREGFLKKGLKLEFSNALIDNLTAVGFDARYGARPLQRAIESVVVNPLAYWLLEHPTVNNTTLKVGYDTSLKVEY